MKRVEARFETFEAVQSGGVVFGSHGETLEVRVLAADVVRVSFLPPGGLQGDVRDWTWLLMGEKVHRSEIVELPGFQSVIPKVQNQLIDIGKGLRVEVCRRSVQDNFGEFQPFELRFIDSNRSGEAFLSDAILGAYAREEGGCATHRIQRKEDEEFCYGLGEVSGPLNRSGRKFTLKCRDAMGYDAETSDPLYKHFPFYITYNKRLKMAFGLLYDHLCSGSIDLGKEISAFQGSFCTYTCDAGFVEYYVIVGPSIAEVVEKVGRIVGRPTIPPGWALGYVASTMTYADAPNAQDRLQAFPSLCKSHKMPCSGFYLSSGYTMDDEGNRNVFTWNFDRVPKPETMVRAFHNSKMKLIANVKPWMLRAHPKYDEVKNLGGFFRESGGDDALLGWFWKGGPGTFAAGSYFDFTNQEMYEMWKRLLKENVLQVGIDSVWNDNNEYEINDDSAICDLDEAPIGVLGRALQTLLMAKASHEALMELKPGKRPLVVSRSGCLGISRFSAQTWSGDNSTSYHTMKWNIPMSLGLSLCGWVGNGADVGGFTGDAVTPELLVRWIQLGIYMPRFSIHSSSWKKSKGASRLVNEDEYNLDCTNEPWMFPEMIPTVQNLLHLRHQLRPFLMSLHIEASMTSAPVMRPLVYHYAIDVNDRSREESFEFLLGRDLLVAPVLEEAVSTREVYFPGDATHELWCDAHTGLWYSGGTTCIVDAPLEGRNFGAPVFIRHGSGLVIARHDDSEARVVMLACHPLFRGEFSHEWLEDPTEGQEGIFEKQVKVSIRVEVTDSEMRIVEVQRNENMALPFKSMDIALLPRQREILPNHFEF